MGVSGQGGAAIGPPTRKTLTTHLSILHENGCRSERRIGHTTGHTYDLRNIHI